MTRHMWRWWKEFRRYLIAAPLVLAIGFGWPVYHAWHGNDGVAHRADDVAKGEKVRLGPGTVEFVGLKVEQPRKSSSAFDTSEVPSGAVVVIATFRARIDDVKGYKDFYCDSNVYNDEGWEWPSVSGGLSTQYVPADTPKNCDGKTLDKNFKDVVPRPHTWYDFVLGYYVPRDRAKGLRPTLEFYKENPRYLRFSSS